MAINRRTLEKWLKPLPENAEVCIDRGGMCLILEGDEDVYLEIGGDSTCYCEDPDACTGDYAAGA